MSLKSLISKIANHSEILAKPPVLFDIGASLEINKYWKLIADFSICVAFDADERDFEYSSNTDSGYKKLIKVNKIVVAEGGEKQDFYLTKFPYCSSILKPNNQALQAYHYSEFFEVDKKISIETIALPQVLKDLDLSYIDWFKTDSQGTDLRLFKSLPDMIKERVLTVEIEPGFIDAYHNEDKLSSCISYFETLSHLFLTEFNVKGPLRIPSKEMKKIFPNASLSKAVHHSYRVVPGWAEINYMNDLHSLDVKNAREFMLAWLFATLQKHHEIAYVFAMEGKEKFLKEPIFDRLQKYSKRKLTYGLASFTNFGRLLKNSLEKIKS